MDPRDARIAELEEQVAARDVVIAALMEKVQALTARGSELEARLNQNSTNSSRPPSSDLPGVSRPPRKAPSGRRPGGQPGHKFHKRELLPPEDVTRVVPLAAPERCRGCRAPLRGAPVEAKRHQVVEVPPLKPDVTEYRCEGRECAGCGRVTYAALPPEVQGHVFGERLVALVALLAGKYRLSKRLIQSALSDMVGVDISLGAVCNRDVEVSDALEVPMAEAEAHVREAASVHMDETGWAQGKAGGKSQRAWLWVAVSAWVTVFRISTSRGSEVARAMLGDYFAGFLITDRWCGYNGYDKGLRQLCWAHLTRDFQGFIDRGGEGGRLGQKLMRARHRLFHAWHRVRDGTLSREDFQTRMQPLRRRVGRLLRDAEARAESKTAGMAAQMLTLEEAFWTFIDVEGVEPTNNAGEQAIRPAVMYRKTSYGTQGPGGSRYVERVLTVVATLKQQKRNALEFLTEAIHAQRRGLPAPSLLPEANSQTALAA